MRKLFAKAQDPISCETHALGAVAALGGGLLYLLRGVWTDAAIPAVAAALCFCLSMAALYAASAIYHYYPGTAASGGVKRVLRKMDHSMIYVLIAGSYTPFCVVLLPQPRGTQFCLILWGVALAGVLAKMLWINAPRMLSTAVYLIMGWSVVFVAKDFTALGQPCLTLVALGGICYSVGRLHGEAGAPVEQKNGCHQWKKDELPGKCVDKRRMQTNTSGNAAAEKPPVPEN